MLSQLQRAETYLWYLVRYCELPVCVYVYMFECASTHVCGCMGRLEIDMECLTWSFSTLSIEACSLAQPQSNQSDYFSCFRDVISTSHAGITDDPPNPPRLCMGAGIWILVLMLAWQAICLPNHLPSPSCPFSEVVLLSYATLRCQAWRTGWSLAKVSQIYVCISSLGLPRAPLSW